VPPFFNIRTSGILTELIQPSVPQLSRAFPLPSRLTAGGVHLASEYMVCGNIDGKLSSMTEGCFTCKEERDQ